MNINRTFVLGGTGFQPVVSGILPETDDRRTYARKFFVKPKLFATDEIRQDAGFNRLEAGSTLKLMIYDLRFTIAEGSADGSSARIEIKNWRTSRPRSE